MDSPLYQSNWKSGAQPYSCMRSFLSDRQTAMLSGKHCWLLCISQTSPLWYLQTWHGLLCSSASVHIPPFPDQHWMHGVPPLSNRWQAAGSIPPHPPDPNHWTRSVPPAWRQKIFPAAAFPYSFSARDFPLLPTYQPDYWSWYWPSKAPRTAYPDNWLWTMGYISPHGSRIQNHHTNFLLLLYGQTNRTHPVQ